MGHIGCGVTAKELQLVKHRHYAQNPSMSANAGFVTHRLTRMAQFSSEKPSGLSARKTPASPRVLRTRLKETRF